MTFFANGNVIGNAMVNAAGAASTVVSTLGAGIYSVTAVYGATTNYASSASAPVVEKILGADTSISLLASPNPVIFGQTLRLTSFVTVVQGSGVAAGTITFLDGTQAIGSGTLNANGSTTFTTSSLTLGQHNLTASYAGSSNANASVSPRVNVNVVAVPTSLGLTATPNPASLGQIVTFTASAAGVAQVAGGTVSFSEQGTTLGSVNLDSSGLAAYTTSTLSAGTHTVIATLSPFGNYAGSTSAPLNVVITNFDFAIPAFTQMGFEVDSDLRSSQIDKPFAKAFPFGRLIRTRGEIVDRLSVELATYDRNAFRINASVVAPNDHGKLVDGPSGEQPAIDDPAQAF